MAEKGFWSRKAILDFGKSATKQSRFKVILPHKGTHRYHVSILAISVPKTDYLCRWVWFAIGKIGKSISDWRVKKSKFYKTLLVHTEKHLGTYLSVSDQYLVSLIIIYIWSCLSLADTENAVSRLEMKILYQHIPDDRGFLSKLFFNHIAFWVN